MPTIPITWQNLTNASINGDGHLEKDNDTLAGAGCMDNASGSGDAGARSVEVITGPDWEFQCTLGPDTGSGRSFVGIASGSFTLNYAAWQYAFHVSTFNNTSSTPHPPDSIFVYIGGPPNRTYLDGAWNEGSLLRIVCNGSTVRFYVNSLLMHTAGATEVPSYPLYAVASLACLGGTVVDPKFITTPAGGSVCEIGEEIGDSCSGAWEMPTPGTFPTSIMPTSFYELTPDWGEHGETFADGSQQHNTMQVAPVRRWAASFDGLGLAEADEMDGHYYSTRGALPFSLMHPHTGATITGVRYESYEVVEHEKEWLQKRSVRFVKYL